MTIIDRPAATAPSNATSPQPAPSSAGGFPAMRLRRMRRTEALRRMVRETQLTPADMLYPLFINERLTSPAPISSMPGQQQWPLEGKQSIAAEAERLSTLGLAGVLLFGIPAEKDEVGSGAYDEQ